MLLGYKAETLPEDILGKVDYNCLINRNSRKCVIVSGFRRSGHISYTQYSILLILCIIQYHSLDVCINLSLLYMFLKYLL